MDEAAQRRARVAAEELIQLCSEVLQRVELPPADARLTAETLVRSELEGAASHGLSRLPILVRRIKAGLVDPRTPLEVVHDAPATALLDAHNGVGQVVAAQAMELAIGKARRLSLGAVAVRESSHLGRAGHAALAAAHDGFIGIVASNASPRLVPGPGASPLLGNNPWALAVPARETPLVIDMANSVVAAGKVRVALAQGESIPLDWALDEQGRPTDDPARALQGALLGIGGHKGWAISLAVDLLSGVLSGGAYGGQVAAVDDMSRSQRSAHFFLALDVSAFLPPAEFVERVEALRAQLQQAGGPDARLPGERSAQLYQQHLAEGIALSDAAHRALNSALAAVDLPDWQPL